MKSTPIGIEVYIFTGPQGEARDMRPPLVRLESKEKNTSDTLRYSKDPVGVHVAGLPYFEETAVGILPGSFLAWRS